MRLRGSNSFIKSSFKKHLTLDAFDVLHACNAIKNENFHPHPSTLMTLIKHHLVS